MGGLVGWLVGWAAASQHPRLLVVRDAYYSEEDESCLGLVWLLGRSVGWLIGRGWFRGWLAASPVSTSIGPRAAYWL